jgi:hypothetical protein
MYKIIKTGYTYFDKKRDFCFKPTYAISGATILSGFKSINDAEKFMSDILDEELEIEQTDIILK